MNANRRFAIALVSGMMICTAVAADHSGNPLGDAISKYLNRKPVDPNVPIGSDSGQALPPDPGAPTDPTTPPPATDDPAPWFHISFTTAVPGPSAAMMPLLTWGRLALRRRKSRR